MNKRTNEQTNQERTNERTNDNTQITAAPVPRELDGARDRAAQQAQEGGGRRNPRVVGRVRLLEIGPARAVARRRAHHVDVHGVAVAARDGDDPLRHRLTVVGKRVGAVRRGAGESAAELF